MKKSSYNGLFKYDLMMIRDSGLLFWATLYIERIYIGPIKATVTERLFWVFAGFSRWTFTENAAATRVSTKEPTSAFSGCYVGITSSTCPSKIPTVVTTSQRSFTGMPSCKFELKPNIALL